MHKIAIYQTTQAWFAKNEYLMAKICANRSLLPSDPDIGKSTGPRSVKTVEDQ